MAAVQSLAVQGVLRRVGGWWPTLCDLRPKYDIYDVTSSPSTTDWRRLLGLKSYSLHPHNPSPQPLVVVDHSVPVNTRMEIVITRSGKYDIGQGSWKGREGKGKTITKEMNLT